MSHSEKRRGRRKLLSGTLEFYDSDGVLMTGVGRLRDLSIMGCLMETSAPLSVGQALRFQLRLDPKMNLALEGSVVRVVSKGVGMVYGVQFNNLSPENLRRIQALI